MKSSLEHDLFSSKELVAKIRAVDGLYAQNLYAAMCNHIFIKDDGSEWSCSWRYAGGMVARIRCEGDYMDWYCSGIYAEKTGWVGEQTVTDEIRADILSIGWTITDYPIEEMLK